MLPEQALVRDLARAAIGGPTVAGWRLAPDPSHAVALADELGVLGITSSEARRTNGAHQLWLDAWRANLARNVGLSFEMRRWWTMLETAGHRPVAFKGPALARAAFGDLGSRDSCDLDFIIPPSRFTEAVALLVRQGLAPRGDLPVSHDHIGALTLDVPDAAHAYAIDLHCGWVERWGGTGDRELQDADLEPVVLAGSALRTLDARRALVHSAIHFEQHDYMLKMLLDVAMTARRVRALRLLTEAQVLASRLGVRPTMELALTAADEFVREGRASRLPRGLRTAEALAAPRPPGMTLRRWRQLRPAVPTTGLLAAAVRTAWPSRAHLRAAPEWVGQDRLALRRILRPIRLLLKIARPVPAQKAALWRQRPPLRFAAAPPRERGGADGRS